MGGLQTEILILQRQQLNVLRATRVAFAKMKSTGAVLRF
jgi:hypothetical protein